MDSPRKTRPETIFRRSGDGGGDGARRRRREEDEERCGGQECLGTCVTLNDSGIQLAVGPQPLRLRNHNSGLAHRIMVKRLETSPHDPLGITDSACKNQLVVVSVQYGPFNPYIPIRSTIIGKSRVAIDPIAMRTSWRSNSDITSVTSIGYPRMSASGESSTTMHRLLHASGSHPIPTPYDPKTNQYNQDLGLIHSTNGNHLESPKEGSSIDHQVNIYLHAQNITMFPTNETWYFASQILVSNSGGLILILTAQSTRNMFRIHSDY
ncbi:F-box/kelch-repeat protein-like [Dorcoceras hygrometricum]|uniref:F-box/kelch-repeat protein-like n=1 Tax=Dorcoceras hygrometricum TaxID=472368 RepID=A0A2Z7CIM9_9LAMI|nr:F-box/kelch-repeat protein-like [Dorcoceras hygrometricum]